MEQLDPPPCPFSSLSGAISQLPSGISQPPPDAGLSRLMITPKDDLRRTRDWTQPVEQQLNPSVDVFKGLLVKRGSKPRPNKSRWSKGVLHARELHDLIRTSIPEEYDFP